MTDADHLDRHAYRTQADYCRHMAEETDGAFDEPWALLAAAWTKLAEETKARSRGSTNASQGLFLCDRAADHTAKGAVTKEAAN